MHIQYSSPWQTTSVQFITKVVLAKRGNIFCLKLIIDFSLFVFMGYNMHVFPVQNQIMEISTDVSVN